MEECVAKKDPVREFLRKMPNDGTHAAQNMTPDPRSPRRPKIAVGAREAKRQALR
jgi:hypothetical protein